MSGGNRTYSTIQLDMDSLFIKRDIKQIRDHNINYDSIYLSTLCVRTKGFKLQVKYNFPTENIKIGLSTIINDVLI